MTALNLNDFVQHSFCIISQFDSALWENFCKKKGRDCINLAFLLTTAFSSSNMMAPPVGLEPTTSWLTVTRSTDWAKEEYTGQADLTRFLMRCRRRPNFPGRCHPSILGTAELNYRVRNGNGWTLCVIITDYRIFRYIKRYRIPMTVHQKSNKEVSRNRKFKPSVY